MSASERPHGSGLLNVGRKVASPAVGNVTRGKKRRTQPEEPICDGPQHRAKAMARAKYRPDRLSGRTMQTNITEKLQDIVTDIKGRGHANLTRLTVLKKWFEAPSRIMSFGAFIAIQASRQTRKTTKEVEQLLCEAREILVDVDLFMPKISKDRATRLHARLEAFQDERRDTRWASVRIIHNRNLFFIERGLGLYLWHRNSPSQAYQVAASYSEHYDPRYGNGLSGPSGGFKR